MRTTSRRRPSAAFTLIELIVVLVILGLITALAVPSFDQVKARTAKQTLNRTAELVVREASASAALDEAPLTNAYIDAAISALDAQGATVSTDGDGASLSRTIDGELFTVSISGNGTITDSDTVVTYAVGDIGPGGGIIFMTPQTSGVGKYFEVAPADQADTYLCDVISWITFGYDNSLIGSGQQNKAVFQGVCASGAAVTTYTIGGKSDWYIPSQQELGMIYQQRALIPGLTGGNYWSSTAVNDIYAYHLTMENGVWNGQGKTSVSKVRPIRSFS